ncbi:MAG: hypothetical protein WKF57_22605 [Nakamurella sp.]
MTNRRGPSTTHVRRRTRGGVIALAALVLAGCGGTATGSPATDSRVSAASTSATQPNLVLDVEFSAPSPASPPSQVDLVASITAVLGDVDELSDAQQDGSDAYVGMLDGRYSVSMTLPDATPDQLHAARRALVGARRFALRPVTSGRIDAQLCTSLLAAPQPDRMCVEQTSEVLTLGTDLGVLPSRVDDSATQGTQAAAAALTFAAADARTIAEYTGAHMGDRLAVTDGLVLVTAPTIQSASTAGSIVISGGFTASQAHAMVGRLRLATLGATINVGS